MIGVDIEISVRLFVCLGQAVRRDPVEILAVHRGTDRILAVDFGDDLLTEFRCARLFLCIDPFVLIQFIDLGIDLLLAFLSLFLFFGLFLDLIVDRDLKFVFIDTVDLLDLIHLHQFGEEVVDFAA